MEPTALTVTAAAALTALRRLGAVPFAVVHRPSRSWLGLANAAAAGFMLAASLALVLEGRQAGVAQTLGGAVLGVVVRGRCTALARRPRGHRRRRACAGSTPGAP